MWSSGLGAVLARALGSVCDATGLDDTDVVRLGRSVWCVDTGVEMMMLVSVHEGRSAHHACWSVLELTDGADWCHSW